MTAAVYLNTADEISDFLNTEDEIRDAALKLADECIAEMCRHKRADGEPPEAIEAWAAAAKRGAAEKIEREIPRLMRDQAIQLGAASLH